MVADKPGVSVMPASDLPSGSKLDNRRVGAALIDVAIMLPLLLLLSALVGDTTGFPLLAAGWALFYYFAWESGAGQTPGKHLMKLRVVRADGRPADMGAIAVRTALRLVDSLFGYLLGLVVMLRTGERRQRIGDLAAKTIVADSRLATAGGPAVAADTTGDETYGDGFAAPGADEPDAGSEATHSEPVEPVAEAPVETVDVQIVPEPEPEPAFEPLGAPLEEVEPEAYEEPAQEPEPSSAPLESIEMRAEEHVDVEPGGAPLELIEPQAHTEPPVEPDQLGVPLDEKAQPVEYAWATAEEEDEPAPADESEEVEAAEPQSAADLLFGEDADQDDEPQTS
jgi:uncharacterized RDD family membrane protein YckC